MTQVLERNSENASVIASIDAVLAKASVRNEEFDQNRAIPEDLFDSLEETGFFAALTPKSYGGLELSLADINQILINGAKASGSLGWVMMVGVHQSMALGSFPPETIRALLAENPKLRMRGVVAPKGVAISVEGGYIVSGRWSFASGGPKPQYLAGNCILMKGGAPVISEFGVPEMLIGLMRASEVTFHDTWHTLGMRGTDSCDFSAQDVFVPTGRTSSIFTARNCFDTPAARLPIRVVYSLGHAAVAIGIASGAHDEVLNIAKTKRAAMNPTALLANDVLFRHTIGENELKLTALRALLDKVTADTEAVALSGRDPSPYDIMMARAITAYITSECATIVRSSYTRAGGAALYESNPLQRRLRDIHVATQHIAAFDETYQVLGAVLVGAEVSPMDLNK